MRDERPYLDCKLVQRDIAKKLHISNRTLSRLLSEQAGKNFNSFVNEYRVAEARRLMQDRGLEHLSLEALASRAGFNSRAVFYRCFKLAEEISPARYRANQR